MDIFPKQRRHPRIRRQLAIVVPKALHVAIEHQHVADRVVVVAEPDVERVAGQCVARVVRAFQDVIGVGLADIRLLDGHVFAWIAARRERLHPRAPGDAPARGGGDELHRLP